MTKQYVQNILWPSCSGCGLSHSIYCGTFYLWKRFIMWLARHQIIPDVSQEEDKDYSSHWKSYITRTSICICKFNIKIIFHILTQNTSDLNPLPDIPYSLYTRIFISIITFSKYKSDGLMPCFSPWPGQPCHLILWIHSFRTVDSTISFRAWSVSGNPVVSIGVLYLGLCCPLPNSTRMCLFKVGTQLAISQIHHLVCMVFIMFDHTNGHPLLSSCWSSRFFKFCQIHCIQSIQDSVRKIHSLQNIKIMQTSVDKKLFLCKLL